MKLDKNTVTVLKNFSSVNTNLVIKPGKTFSTMSPAKDILATYTGDVEFDNTLSIYNLNEFLAVLTAFEDPSLELSDNYVTISEGNQKVTYVYADESLLITPTKKLNFPTPEIEFNLSKEQLMKILKMSAILSVDELSFIGDGDKIIARVSDSKNPSGNSFDIDLETKNSLVFKVIIKVEKIKVLPGGYKVEISSVGISKFTSDDAELQYYVGIESTSTFK